MEFGTVVVTDGVLAVVAEGLVWPAATVTGAVGSTPAYAVRRATPPDAWLRLQAYDVSPAVHAWVWVAARRPVPWLVGSASAQRAGGVIVGWLLAPKPSEATRTSPACTPAGAASVTLVVVAWV